MSTSYGVHLEYNGVAFQPGHILEDEVDDIQVLVALEEGRRVFLKVVHEVVQNEVRAYKKAEA